MLACAFAGIGVVVVLDSRSRTTVSDSTGATEDTSTVMSGTAAWIILAISSASARLVLRSSTMLDAWLASALISTCKLTTPCSRRSRIGAPTVSETNSRGTPERFAKACRTASTVLGFDHSSMEPSTDTMTVTTSTRTLLVGRGMKGAGGEGGGEHSLPATKLVTCIIVRVGS